MASQRTVLIWGIIGAVLAGIAMLLLYNRGSHSPDRVGLAFLEGIQADKRGDLPAAAAKYLEATVLDPKFCSGYFNLADALERQSKTSEALVSFRTALLCFEGGTVHSFLGAPSETILRGDIQRTVKRIEALQKAKPAAQP